MKKYLLIIGILLILSVGLFAQNLPRVINVRLVNQDGTALPNVTNGITFQANLLNGSTNTQTELSGGCGFTFAGGNLYAKVELGNFSNQWALSHVMTIAVQRASDSAAGSLDNIIIPDATGNPIWWGRPPGSTTFPGTPVILVGEGPTTHTISGTFTGSWDFLNIEINATDILPEDITITGAAYEIVVPDAWTGMVTPVKAGFIMTPEYREYTSVMDDMSGEDYAITQNVDPLVPTITYPAEGQVFEWEVAGEVSITWEAGTGYLPEYYEIKWGVDEWTALDPGVVQWTTPEIGTGNYTFMVRGVIDTPRGKSYTNAKALTNSRSAGNVNTNRGAGAEATVNFEVIVEPVTEEYTLNVTSLPTGAAIYLDGENTLQVTPYEFYPAEAGVYTVVLGDNTWTPESYTYTADANATVNFEGALPEYDIDPETPTEIEPGTDVTIAGGGFVGGTVVTGGLTPVPNPTFVATSEGILQLVGTGLVTITFDFDPAVDWFIYLEGGVWQVIAGPLSTYDVVVDLGAKDGSLEFKSGSGGDPTLPVELSVFNAVLTVNKFVELTWISESETNMLGYRVYRNESQEAASAICITPELIPASNTSSTRIYNLTDMEVVAGNTYYYWLEAADFGHSTMFGPQYVEVTAEETPVLPAHTVMNNAYPNPFKASTVTNINVNLKAGDHGSVTIYNVLGQVVKTYKVVEGINPLTWNGQDSRGNACGSGIYFYKLSTNSLNQTKKMVIVK